MEKDKEISPFDLVQKGYEHFVESEPGDVKYVATEPVILQKDFRILRECLVWAQKQAPPHVKQLIHQKIIKFSESIKSYCTCPERVYVDKEGKYACLDCGQRHWKPEGKDEVQELG